MEDSVNLERESEGDLRERGIGVVMDTPERNKIATTPLSKFEDSPVFNYINSLSPIQPVKSVHFNQTFNSLSYASPPSVFTSPHVSSLKESRFLRRHNFSESPIPSTENVNKVVAEDGIQDVSYNAAKKPEIFDRRSSAECYKHAAEDCNPTTRSRIGSKSVSFDPFVQEIPENGSFGNEEGSTQGEQNPDCDWESLISDGAIDLFDSPKDMECMKGLSGSEPGCAVGLSERFEPENPSTQPGEVVDIRVMVENQDTVVGEPSEKMDDELASNPQRGGPRRRCLDFEMVGSRRKQFDDGSGSGSSTSSQSPGNTDPINKRLKLGNDSSARLLTGIGLHLNSLAANPVGHNAFNHEALAPGGQIISVPCPSASLHSLSTGQEPPNKLMGPLDVEDASQASGYVLNEELNQNSPKKKRRKSEEGGESGTCKRCNCKKSKCLKLYCECFAAGVYCVEPCSCRDCFNKPIHEETVLATRKLIESRNPLAFAPKVIRSSEPVPEIGGSKQEESSITPVSARHKRGCNCKKSGCLKKYCECYQGGVGCSVNCRCEGCKNAFGRKDGSEVQLEDEEMGECEKSVVDKAFEKSLILYDAEQNIESDQHGTPLPFPRSSIQLPFASNKRPPRSTALTIGSSSGLYQMHKFGKPNLIPPPATFEKLFQPVGESEKIPEILEKNGSPISCIKSSSPNSKRVSPPHGEIGSAQGQRSSRKLILRSIPSFPSLDHKN